MRRLLAALILISVSASAQKKILILETYKKNDSTKSYKQIFVTGEGNMQSKMYLQNISSELTEALKEKNIECRYEFLGDNHKVDVEEAYARAKAGQYDVILRAIPRSTDESLHTQTITSMDPNTGSINRYQQRPGEGKTKSILTNDFDFVLTEKSGAIVWQGRLKTDIDPTARNVYRKIASKLLDELEENKIIPAK
jgi:hypothetical protein